jgi:lipopolysaccharide export system permease protein
MNHLDRYVAGAVLRSLLMAGLGLTALFSLLEFVEQLTFVGQGRYRALDALTYTAMTIPARLLQVTPAAVLLGNLLALGALARSSEITALRALGVSEARIISAVLKLAGALVIILFLLAQYVVPSAQQYALGHRTAALADTAPGRSGTNFWAERDRQYLNVGRFRDGNIPTDISIYTFAEDGSLSSYIHAERGDLQGRDWVLYDVMRKYPVTVNQLRTEKMARLVWRSFLPPQQTQLLTLPPESIPPVALFRYVRDLERRGQESLRYKQELWARIALPFSIAAMILVAAPFVFGPTRSQSTGGQVAIAALVGMAFTLVQQIASRLDLLLNLNPALTALAPPLGVMALSLWLFKRLHR